MSVGSETQHEARKAIDAHLINVIYPVIYSGDHGLITLGTAVLFKCLGRYFLLTAAHLFEKHDGPRFPFENLVGPTMRGKGIPVGLGKIAAFVPKTSDGGELDVIAIELHDAETIATIERVWTFLEPADIDLRDSEDLADVHVVAGFPKEPEQDHAGFIAATFMTVTTRRSVEPPETLYNLNPAFDLFLEYGRTGSDVYDDYRDRETTHPRGVSGGGVFRVYDDQSNVWTPRRGLRLVGIQSSVEAHSLKWLRVTNVAGILAYFQTAIPEVAAEITKQASAVSDQSDGG